jgi:hypothetical protein
VPDPIALLARIRLTELMNTEVFSNSDAADSTERSSKLVYVGSWAVCGYRELRNGKVTDYLP